jgi:hypothetical protein
MPPLDAARPTRRTFLHAASAAPIVAAAPAAAPTGGRLELFLDRDLAERFSGGARLRLHHPERREIALVHDAPWEGSGTGYHTVFQDGARYRMYYKAWSLANPRKPPKVLICYAESGDGVRWEKPNLDLVEYAGSKRNNILLDDVGGGYAHDFSPFLDLNPAATPDARYKGAGLGKPTGLYGLKSADGVHWVKLQEQPILSQGVLDTQNITFWDARVRLYRAYIRDFDSGRRDIKTATSPDYLHWSKAEWLRYPGAPAEQLYTNQVKPYYRAPHLYIGFPSRYVDRGWTESALHLPELDLRRQRAQISPRYGTAVTDALLMSSVDGLHFHRWDEAFLRPGPRTRHNWSYGDNYLAWHVVETASPADDEPRELSLYATESYFTGAESRLRRLALRIDGFVSAFAPLGGGETITRAFTYSGRTLSINYSTSAGGGLRFELQDASGVALPGCELDACDPIYGDSIRQQVAWKDAPDLSRWEGRPVRLRIELRDADLYSFQFGPLQAG